MDVRSHAGAKASVTVRLVGGPTALIGIGGLRLLTDPAFDPPGPVASGTRTLVKTRGPAVPVEEIGTVHAVLLSHDQHADNLDRAGRRLLDTVPVTLTTAEAADRLGGPATALRPWQRLTLDRPDGGYVEVTGAPAQHGPDGTEDITGPVTGFVLTGPDVPTIYVSGDNASLDVVRRIADRFGPLDLALLFAGAARTPLLDGHLTLTSDQAAQAARILGARTVIPLHTEGWEHFTEGPDAVREAFARHGLADRLTLLAPGDAATVRHGAAGGPSAPADRP
ncbi:MBL fold metallo-hydrolase [Streptomyces lushanensis]|uniref:MBL fold metallo-hydrolase n=1 Tax=Streptomyces lushanensis TaxID=1434255 RepID=UPI000833897C|nr:MBL fold metallo-hydrolase [Streptomyces lushanensis]